MVVWYFEEGGVVLYSKSFIFLSVPDTQVLAIHAHFLRAASLRAIGGTGDFVLTLIQTVYFLRPQVCYFEERGFYGTLKRVYATLKRVLWYKH